MAPERTPGVLADAQIRQMIADGAIAAASPILNDQIQPASLDLRLGERAYRVRASFLPGLGRTVAERLDDLTMHEVPLTGGAVLEKGCVYVVPLMERLSLPQGMTAAASAKSSIGRLDMMTRVITDQGIEFDRVPDGYDGPLYAEICPQSFSVVAQPGQLLTQIIFRLGRTFLSDDELRAVHAETPIVSGTPVISDGLGFSVDLKPQAGDLVGYRAKRHSGVVDLSKLGHYDPADYWEEVRTTKGQIILDPGAFYILVSREAIAIPPIAPQKWRLIWPWLASSGCIMRAFLIPVLAMTPLAGQDHVACWKCAVMRHHLCWSMVRWWDVWSMSACRKRRSALRGGHQVKLPGARPETVQAFKA